MVDSRSKNENLPPFEADSKDQIRPHLSSDERAGYPAKALATSNPGLYLPLSRDTHDIRLLLLLPGAFNDEIECLLCHASLDEEDLHYETISYVWGDQSSRTPIKVDGQKVEVTTNLGDALRHLRMPEEPLTLWADAICINQEDLAEKMHQVGMMRGIYSGCSQNYIWLGCDKPEPDTSATDSHPQGETGDDDPFTFFHHFAADKHWHDLPVYAYDTEKQSWQYSEPDDKESHFRHAMWRGMKTIEQIPWWSRIWTVQEAVLHSSSQVLYGRWRIAWRTLERASAHSVRHAWDCCSQPYNALPRWLPLMLDDLIYHIDTIDFISRIKDGSDHFTQLSFHRVVQFCRCKRATNPLDNIFGLLGLTDPRWYSKFSPDYSHETTTIYESIFRLMLHESDGSLSCFLGSWFNSAGTGSDVHDGQTHSILDPPSWVPDFSNHVHRTTIDAEDFRRRSYSMYQAWPDESKAFHISESSVLQMDGCLAGRVKTIFKVPWNLEKTVKESCSDIKQHVMAALDLQSTSKSTTFWRTIMSDLLLGVNGPTQRVSTQTLFSFEAWLVEEKKDSVMDLRVSNSIDFSVLGRDFFVTEDGSFGLCPSGTQPRDEVWVFVGGNVPFILRPRLDEGEKYHAFIGDCYMDGIMDGEVKNNPLHVRCTALIK